MPKVTFKEYDLHPEGKFAAHITAIEQEEMKYGPALKVHLTTDEGVVECLCSLSYTPKSKLTQLVHAVYGMGNCPTVLDTDDLLSQRVGIVVQTVEGYSKVTSFHALKKAAADKQSAAAADPFADE